MSELEETLRLIKKEGGDNETLFEMMFHKLSDLHQSLLDIHQEMLKHHRNTSMFLESLFRRVTLCRIGRRIMGELRQCNQAGYLYLLGLDLVSRHDHYRWGW